MIGAGCAPGRRAVLQEVRKGVDISLADGWKGRRPQTQIVALDAPGGKLGSF